jgi:hypothetical protein
MSALPGTQQLRANFFAEVQRRSRIPQTDPSKSDLTINNRLVMISEMRATASDVFKALTAQIRRTIFEGLRPLAAQ